MPDPTFSLTDARVRFGFQATDGLPARNLPFQLEISGETITNASSVITNTAFAPGSQTAQAQKGDRTFGGPTTFNMNAEDVIPVLCQMGRFATLEDLAPEPTGAFRITAGPYESVSHLRPVTFEMHRDDGGCEVVYGGFFDPLTVTVANNAITSAELTVNADDGTYWGNAFEVTPSTDMGPEVYFRGHPAHDRREDGRPGNTGDIYVELIELVSPGVFKARAKLGPVASLSSFVDTTAASPNVTAATPPLGLDFRNEIFPGDYVDIKGVVERVDSVTATGFVLANPYPTTESAETAVSTWGPIAGTFEVLAGLSARGKVQWNEVRLSNTGLIAGSDLLRVAFSTGTFDAPASADVPLTGTVDVSAASTLWTGTATSFTTELSVGSTISDGSNNYTVLSIIDDTNLRTTAAHPSGLSGASITAYRQWGAARDRQPFPVVRSASPPLTEIYALMLIDGEETVLDAFSFTLGTARPSAPQLGSPRPSPVVEAGQRAVSFTMTMLYSELTRQLGHKIEDQVAFGVEIVMRSGAPIVPDAEVGFNHTEHEVRIKAPYLMPAGTRPTAAAPGRFTLTTSPTGHPDGGEADVTFEMVGSVGALPVDSAS